MGWYMWLFFYFVVIFVVSFLCVLFLFYCIFWGGRGGGGGRMSGNPSQKACYVDEVGKNRISTRRLGWAFRTYSLILSSL